MSGKLWKQVPDDELVKWLSTSAFLIYKSTGHRPRVGVYQHCITGHYKVALCRDTDFTLAEGLTSKAEVNEYFLS